MKGTHISTQRSWLWSSSFTQSREHRVARQLEWIKPLHKPPWLHKDSELFLSHSWQQKPTCLTNGKRVHAMKELFSLNLFSPVLQTHKAICIQNQHVWRLIAASRALGYFSDMYFNHVTHNNHITHRHNQEPAAATRHNHWRRGGGKNVKILHIRCIIS